MHYVADREGNITKENSLQDRALGALYGSLPGRLLLRPLMSPAVSKACGKALDTRASRALIPGFARACGIELSERERERYASYNDFFTRRPAVGARRADCSKEAFISPCDARLSVFQINGDSVFSVKHSRYTVASVLRNHRLARSYAGGYAWVFRLCVDDYHRYVYVDDGVVSGEVHIPGVFHAVNPAAGEAFPIYKENTREYCLLRSENFGTVLQMEVGAMLVGKIENRPGGRKVRRGEEKGNFSFGGSTIILMTRAGAVRPDEDILKNSGKGIETLVKMGERVGSKPDAGER